MRKGNNMNAQRIPRRALIATVALGILIVSSVGLANAYGGDSEPRPPVAYAEIAAAIDEVTLDLRLAAISPIDPVPLEFSLSVGPLGFSDTQKSDAYQAFNEAETGIQAAMNAIAAIRKGDVAGEPLIASQLSAIVDQGLSGMALAQARISDGLAILSLTQATLDNFVTANPVPDRTWCYEITNAWSGQSGCLDQDDPAYIPVP